MDRKTRNLFFAGFVLGLGLLGAVDGVVFHQLLQWHHVVDHPDHSLEMVSDGIFNALVAALMVWACVKIFRDAKYDRLAHSWRTFVGAIITGGGAFNLVEGLVNHQILQVHHVKPGPNEFVYDMLFLLSGVVLLLIGYLVTGGFGGKEASVSGPRQKVKDSA